MRLAHSLSQERVSRVHILVPVVTVAFLGVLWAGMERTSLQKPLFLVLVGQAILFLLLFRRPVWAIASLIVGQLTSCLYMFSLGSGTTISVRFAWAVLLAFLFVPLLAKTRVSLSLGGKRVLVPAFMFFALATLSNWVYTTPAYTVQYLRLGLTAATILIVVPAAVRSAQDIRILGLVAFVTSLVSAVVGLMQHYSAWGLPNFAIDSGLLSLWGGRVSGLSASPLYLAYGLPLILLPIMALYLVGGVKGRLRIFLGVGAFLMAAALYFTYTRSGICALGVGAIVVALLLKGRMRAELLLSLLIVGGLFWYIADLHGTRYSQGVTGESSAASRIVLWQAAIPMIKANPLLGIGHEKFATLSTEYASAVSQRLEELSGGALGRYEPHNDFINIWVSFGTPALLTFLAFFAGIFFNFIHVYRRSRDPFIRALSLGCLGGLAAYAINAGTHNVMDSWFVLWIMGGLSIAMIPMLSPYQTEKPGDNA